MPKTHNTRQAQLRALIATTTDDCILFPGRMNANGYGCLHMGTRSYLAHRAAWEMHNGMEIPAGMNVLHSCKQTRACVNPRHLRIGTQQENVADMMRDGTHNAMRGDTNGSRLHPESLRRGAAVAWAKLDDKKVREIRELLRNGEVGAVIAVKFKVSAMTISHIKNGRKWRHVK